MRQLDFEPPNYDKFPLLRLAYQAIEQGGVAGCVLNAADEIAVESFLNNEISYPAIAAVVEETLELLGAGQASTIQETLEIDRRARAEARRICAERAVRVS